ncbi:MAG: DNA polymerase IV [Anaerolineae bacterium]
MEHTMPSPRWIVHVDLDAFYPSVEELLNPALKGKPIIVGGDPDARGVVSSASYAARAYGVRSAMPTAQALRLCPHAILLHGHYRIYAEYSRRVMAILREITPVVEQLSIDEAFMDVTGCERLWGAPREIGALVRRRVRSEVGLTVSVGVASSKLVAKIACGQAKPDGMLVVEHGDEASFLDPLPIRELWGVGPVTAERLRELGIERIGDLAGASDDYLERVLGDHGAALRRAARGVDASPVKRHQQRQSISQERTFAEDVGDPTVLARELLRMSEHLAASLRSAGQVAQTVRIKIRYPDFATVTRQMRLEQPTDQGQQICEAAQELLDKHWRRTRSLRLVGVGVTGLIEGAGYQLELFDDADQRRALLNRTLDEIRERFGQDAIQRASLTKRAKDSEDGDAPSSIPRGGPEPGSRKPPHS